MRMGERQREKERESTGLMKQFSAHVYVHVFGLGRGLLTVFDSVRGLVQLSSV